MNPFRPTILAVLMGGSLAFVAGHAASSATAASPVPHHMRGMHHGAAPFAGSPFFRAIRQLNLTDDQKQRIHSMLSTEREQMRASMDAQRTQRAALANPGDAGYPAAVQAAKTAAAEAVQKQSDLQVQIYGLLTPDQQAQLPTVLADMQSRAEQRRAEWQQRHSVKSG